jgi:hypothetical protein
MALTQLDRIMVRSVCRLAQLDDVGVCVNKSSTYRTTSTSHFGTERGGGTSSPSNYSIRREISSVSNDPAHASPGLDNSDATTPSSVKKAEGPLGRTTGTGKAGTARASLLGSGTPGAAVVKPPSLL